MSRKKGRGSISAERDKRQAKVFTKWVNSHLGKRKKEIKSLTKDFDDGVNLCILYEQISGDKLKKVAYKPKGRIQAMSNLSNVLTKVNKFVKECGIGLQYSPQQIADGDEKQILGMLWILITKFVIPESEEDISAKKSLLRWCQRVTEPYDNIDIKNFHKSWKDGLAFNALLHQFDDTLMDYASLKNDDDKGNLEHAFAKAETLGISRLLDPEDITEFEVPDEKSIICYVSTMYQFFHSKVREIIERDMKTFVVDLSKLAKWIKESIDKYQVKEFPGVIDDCKKLEEGLYDFNIEKGKYAEYKCNLYVRLASIQRRQRNERLKIFVPGKDETNLAAVQTQWLTLNSTVVKYSAALRNHIIKLEEEERKRIEGEIKDYEEFERLIREGEKKMVEEEGKNRFDNQQLTRNLLRQGKEEEILRKDEEAKKRRDFEFRKQEAERQRKEEELRKKREKEALEREAARKKKEEDIQKAEAKLKKEREEFRKRVDGEIKAREGEEKGDREKEKVFTDEEYAIAEIKKKLKRAQSRGAKEEAIKRKEQEWMKRQEWERRKREAARKKKEEEIKIKEEEERVKRENERKEKEEEIKRKEAELQKERAAFRKRVDAEIVVRENIEREDRVNEVQRVNDDVKNCEGETEVRRSLSSQRLAENILRKEQEKQKRADAKRRARAAERQAKEEEFVKKETEAREKREAERKAKEEEIQRKADEERKKRSDERERIMKEKKEKEESERKKLDIYDDIASKYMDWIQKTQSELTSVVEVAEDEEDESTDEETRNKRVDVAKEAKEKIVEIQEKWKVLEEVKIQSWASVPYSEVESAKDTMVFALVGEESENLKKLKLLNKKEKMGEKEEKK